MPKHKVKRGSTNIDMTAMCDVAFLLLTFFMLAAKTKPQEPVVVKTPNSISNIPQPSKDVMLITIDSSGRIFFAIDNKNMRKDLISRVNEYKNLGLSENEQNSFAIGGSVGIPFTQLKSYLSQAPDAQVALDAGAQGIPADTATDQTNNDLSAWVSNARNANPQLRICIKADGAASYPSIRKVIATLEHQKVFKFNLITNLKGVPAGTYRNPPHPKERCPKRHGHYPGRADHNCPAGQDRLGAEQPEPAERCTGFCHPEG